MGPTFIFKNYVCKDCGRPYVYADSLERHRREKHPKKHEKKEAKRMKLLRQDRERERKHAALKRAVVTQAMNYWRDSKYLVPFMEACKALDDFEKGHGA